MHTIKIELYHNEKKSQNPTTTTTIQRQQQKYNETISRSRRNSTQDIEVLSRSSDNLAPRPFR